MIGAIAIGFAGGFVAGMLGVGGGVLFVPALTIFAGLDQLDAEATSLLAIVPVALVGAWNQQRYGNVNVRDGALIGVLSAVGVLGGVAIANVVPQRALEIGFAALLLTVAAQLVRHALAGGGDRGPGPAAG